MVVKEYGTSVSLFHLKSKAEGFIFKHFSVKGKHEQTYAWQVHENLHPFQTNTTALYT